MSATRIPEALGSRLGYFDLRLSHQTLILLGYLPLILRTAMGAIVLSIGWILAVNAAPKGVSVVLLTLVQLAWLVSLVNVWLQNTDWVPGRKHTDVSDANLRVPQVIGIATRHL